MARPTKTLARNPVCMLCWESKDSRHVVKIFSKAGRNLEGCPSFRPSLPPSLIYLFMLIYCTHNFWVFFGSCDRLMPGPFPALLIFLRKKRWERGCSNRVSVRDKSKQTVRCSLKHLSYFEAALQSLSIFALHKTCHSSSGFAGLGYI